MSSSSLHNRGRKCLAPCYTGCKHVQVITPGPMALHALGSAAPGRAPADVHACLHIEASARQGRCNALLHAVGPDLRHQLCESQLQPLLQRVIAAGHRHEPPSVAGYPMNILANCPWPGRDIVSLRLEPGDTQRLRFVLHQHRHGSHTPALPLDPNGEYSRAPRISDSC